VVEIEEGGHIVWGDVWLAGRYSRGAASEQFEFRTLVQDLNVRRAGELVFRDRFCWHGPWGKETALWHFGGAPAYGSLLVSAGLPPEAVTSPTGARSASQEVLAGASGSQAAKHALLTTAHGHTCLRCLGTAEEVTQGIVRTALAAAAHLDRSPRPWLTTADLAPNHWFSTWPE
jgi:urease accessory protein